MERVPSKVSITLEEKPSMRVAIACMVLLSAAPPSMRSQQRAPVDFTGVWKLETLGADTKTETFLELKHTGTNLSGKLKTPHGEFPIENGSAEGQSLFFNVVIERDDYKLKTTYRGQFFSAEIQFTVEAGERTLQVIAQRRSA